MFPKVDSREATWFAVVWTTVELVKLSVTVDDSIGRRRPQTNSI